MRPKVGFFIATVLFSIQSFVSVSCFGQSIGGNFQTDGKRLNSISTASPFLLIGPDSRAGAMGDVGGASLPDVSSMHWNPAKYAFATEKSEIGLDYSPWLRSLGIQDINLSYLSAYFKLNEQETVASSIRYFSMGQLLFTDNTGQEFAQYNPSEYAFDAAYIRKLSDLFSMAVAARFIHSNLGAGNVDGKDFNPGSAFAADVALFYTKNIELFKTPANVAWGANISNIGTKMQYGTSKNFLPTNLRIGGSTRMDFDGHSSLSFNVDLNKLLVPTNPIYDSHGDIIVGSDPNKTTVDGIFSSFGDAPGGFKEEMQEISYSAGLEYWYDNLIAVRSGYFYENPHKGDRQYFTVGTGIKYNGFGMNFAYLIPGRNHSPLEKTIRLSLSINLGKHAIGGNTPPSRDN